MKIFLGLFRSDDKFYSCFYLDTFIQKYGNKYDIYIIQLNGIPDSFLPNIKRISIEDFFNVKDRAVVIFQGIWDSFRVPSNMKSLVLSYYSAGAIYPYLTNQHRYLTITNGIDTYLCNYVNHNYDLTEVGEKCIGDIQIESILNTKNLPEYDIVYFPNFIANQASANHNWKREYEIVYNVLSKYSSKYKVITLPHPAYRENYIINGIKWVNGHFNLKNDLYIPKAKVIINSCKSFIGLSMFFNRPLIHFSESYQENQKYNPLVEEYVNKWSYKITNLTEDALTKAIEEALKDTKEEERKLANEKYCKEMFSYDAKSPTDRLEEIIFDYLKYDLNEKMEEYLKDIEKHRKIIDDEKYYKETFSHDAKSLTDRLEKIIDECIQK